MIRTIALVIALLMGQVTGTSHRGVFKPIPGFVNAVGAACSSATSCSVNITPATTGDALFAFGSCGASATCTLTFSGSQGESWATKVSNSVTNDGDNTAQGCAISANTSTDAVKVTQNGAAARVRIIVYEVKNATCTFDTTSSPTGGSNASDSTCSSACTSGNLTITLTGVTSDFLFGTLFGSGTLGTTTPGTGWIKQTCLSDSAGFSNPCSSTSNRMAVAMKVGTTASTFKFDVNVANSQENALIIGAYKE